MSGPRPVLAEAPLSDPNAADGISIPATYTAHLAPLSSAKLHGEVRGQAQKKAKNEDIAYETPYVVMFQQVNLLSGDPASGDNSGRCGGRIQECWGFEHPRQNMVIDSRGEAMAESTWIGPLTSCLCRCAFYQFAQHSLSTSQLPDTTRRCLARASRLL